MQTISADVGLNCANRPSDVLTIQSLLNGVPSNLGGPTTPLDRDGIFGDQTAHAISAFQMKQFGWADCAVSPGQVTLMRLNAASQQTDVLATINAIIALIGRIGQIPDVYFKFGCEYLLLRSQCSKLGQVLPIARESSTDVRVSRINAAPPVFGEILPFPFPTPAGGAAGAGPQAIIFFALLLLLFIITNRPAILPHTDADKVLERELSELEKLTIMLSVNQARKMQQEVKAEVKTIEDCGMQRLERIAAGGKCNDLWELFKKVSADLLRKLNTFINSPVTFPGLAKAINDGYANYKNLREALRRCLECDKLAQERNFFRPTRSIAPLRRWSVNTLPLPNLRQRGCGFAQLCSSCP